MNLADICPYMDRTRTSFHSATTCEEGARRYLGQTEEVSWNILLPLSCEVFCQFSFFELLVLFLSYIFWVWHELFSSQGALLFVYSSRKMSTTEGWKTLIVVLCLNPIFRKDTYGVFSEPVDSRLVGINLLITITLWMTDLMIYLFILDWCPCGTIISAGLLSLWI